MNISNGKDIKRNLPNNINEKGVWNKEHSKSNMAPKIQAFYNVPLFGQKTWKTDMVGGGLGLVLHWDL